MCIRDRWEVGKLTFYEPDMETFSCLKTAKEAIRRGKLYPTLMNCANELAVQLFLDGKISFLQIAELNQRVLELDGRGEVTAVSYTHLVSAAICWSFAAVPASRFSVR